MFKKINQIKVNIVLPNYNSGEIILETLDSILSQTFKNWQLIIVDDNTTTNSKIVKKIFKTQKNKNNLVKKK